MKKGLNVMLIIAVLSSLLFMLSIASATVTFSNKSTDIQTKYVGGDLIKGSINLSFKNEYVNSKITSTFNGSVNVIDLLKSNGFSENEGFKCTVKGCSKGFTAGEGVTDLQLNSGSEEFIGFKVTGNNVEINDVKFTIRSTAQASCTQSLVLDVFSNDTYLVQNFKYRNVTCGNKLTG